MIKIINSYHEEHPNPYNWPSVKEDHLALMSIIDKFNIKTIFEFGTWEGYTTQLLSLHPNVTKITTLDIHENIDVAYEHRAHNKTNINNYGKYFKGNKKITQIFCDSLKFNPIENVDMVFIDANHDYEHVKNDTELALKMNPKVIAWHDYHSPGNIGVEIYIDELIAKDYNIIHIPDSVVAYWEVENESK